MRIAVCDDDQFQRELLLGFINPYAKQYPQIIIEQFPDGEELMLTIKRNQQFDIIFLDIGMKIKDGIQTAKEIRELKNDVIIIFITSFTNFVSDAFTLDAFQYLIKPINKSLFSSEFERAINLYYTKHYKYSITHKSGFTALPIKDIVYIESYLRHLYVYTTDSKYEALGKLDDEHDKLLPLGFTRTHKSFLINMEYIKVINDDEVVCINGIVVPLSSRKKADVKKQYVRYLTKCTL